MNDIVQSVLGARQAIVRDPIFVFGPYILIGLSYALAVSVTTRALLATPLPDQIPPNLAIWILPLFLHPLAQAISVHAALNRQPRIALLHRLIIVWVNRCIVLVLLSAVLGALFLGVVSATYWLVTHGATTTGLLCQLVGVIVSFFVYLALRYSFSYVLVESMYGGTFGLLAIPKSIQISARDLLRTGALSLLGFVFSSACSLTIILTPIGLSWSDLALADRWNSIRQKKLEDETPKMR